MRNSLRLFLARVEFEEETGFLGPADERPFGKVGGLTVLRNRIRGRLREIQKNPGRPKGRVETQPRAGLELGGTG